MIHLDDLDNNQPLFCYLDNNNKFFAEVSTKYQ